MKWKGSVWVWHGSLLKVRDTPSYLTSPFMTEQVGESWGNTEQAENTRICNRNGINKMAGIRWEPTAENKSQTDTWRWKSQLPTPITGQEEPEEEANCSTYLVRDLFLGEVSKHERHRTDLWALQLCSSTGKSEIKKLSSQLPGISRSWSLLHESRQQVLARLALHSKEKSMQLLFLHW